MCLRKVPSRTSAFLCANRQNALKSTGPRTLAGKARSCLNALKHGRYARSLHKKLLAAGYPGRAAFYTWIREDIIGTFGLSRSSELGQASRWANQVYAVAQRAGVLGTKPECPLLSARLGPRILAYSRFRIHDPWARRGLSYWVQRKKFWNRQRVFKAARGKEKVEEPPLRKMLEHRLRRRVVWLRRPSLWRLEKIQNSLKSQIWGWKVRK